MRMVRGGEELEKRCRERERDEEGGRKELRQMRDEGTVNRIRHVPPYFCVSLFLFRSSAALIIRVVQILL